MVKKNVKKENNEVTRIINCQITYIDKGPNTSDCSNPEVVAEALKKQLGADDVNVTMIKVFEK